MTCTTIMDRPAHLVTTSDNNPKYLVSELRQAVRPMLATSSIAQLLLYAQILCWCRLVVCRRRVVKDVAAHL